MLVLLVALVRAVAASSSSARHGADERLMAMLGGLAGFGFGGREGGGVLDVVLVTHEVVLHGLLGLGGDALLSLLG